MKLMKIELLEEGIDSNTLSFSTIENTAINIDASAEVHQNLRAPAFLNQQLIKAINLGASDIHFEPYAENSMIRFRVDGVMQNSEEIPKAFGHLIITRLKVISGLDISEQEIGQSGRFRMAFGSKNDQHGINFRCSVVPTIFGEVVNLRVLYLPEGLMQLSQLGFDHNQITPINYQINRLQGMVLVTGPTGSGKTVTLYTLLKHVNKKPRSIFTVEDPVEIEHQGINQINVSKDNTFSDVARTLLRQDPDVIMLGEMRDSETCQTAIRAAHTGHLVLSTLHANSATKSISRLANLGVKRHDIASVLSLIISQRLLRNLDPETKEEVTLSKEKLLTIGFTDEEIPSLKLFKAVPGKENNGYKGRTGIFQIVSVTPDISKMIAEGATDEEIDQHLFKQGIDDIRCHALNKAKEGITDIDEIERVLGYVGGVQLNSDY
jgi:type IV pilus assembly protein PilB